MVRACEFCRRRKIKCDTAKPICSPCRRNSRSCVYHNGPQKQRPSAALIKSLRDETAVLQDTLGRLKSATELERNALLESIVLHDGRVSVCNPQPVANLDTSHRHDDVSANRFQTTPYRPDLDLADHAQTTSTGSRGALAGAEADMGDVHENDEDDGDSDVDASHYYARSSSSRDDEYDETTAPVGATNKSHEDSDTMFCSTSAIRVDSPAHSIAGDHSSKKHIPQSTESLRDRLIANAALERQREHRLRAMTTIRGIPAELALHLLDLHWSRQHHTFLLTYRPTFMRELVDGGPYCSDLLLHAVFACSSKFSERLEVCDDPRDPETAGKRFFARCDELLLREGLLSRSQIPTVIALIMLGSTFIARGMTSKGWLYTGYALRMIYDLGLHVDSEQVNMSNVEEVEIRRRVFWGAFICEKLQSLYLGRPPTIRLQDARVSRDFLDTFEELELWEPYQDPAKPESSRNMMMPSAKPHAYSVSVFQQLCLLSKIMTRIINKIYFVGATAWKTSKEIRPLDDALQAWYLDLPAHLPYEPWKRDLAYSSIPVAPNRIILLTTYHSLVVLLHRPFIAPPSSGAGYQSGNIDSGGNHQSARMSTYSWKRCTTAARNITSLTLSYRSIYPLRRSSYLLSYAVYVACTIHVLNAASLSSGGDKTAYAECSSLLAASLGCLDELAVPNSGVANTARIIRKLMAAKGVQELPRPVEFEPSAPDRLFGNPWQFSNSSPTQDDLAQMQSFQDLCLPGQDLLFGFMNENLSLTAFGIDDNGF